VRNSARLIEAIVRIFARNLLAGIDPDCLIAALGAFETPEDIGIEAHDLSRNNPAMSWVDAMVEVILTEAREQQAEQVAA
jgi:hypothetical protein